MPFQTVCPGCRAVIQIGDQFVGIKVRCKKCQQVFSATPRMTPSPSQPARAAEAKKPPKATDVTARRPSREQTPPPQAHRTPERRKPHSSLALAIGVGAAAGLLVLVVGGAGAWWLFSSQGGDKAQPNHVAINDSMGANLPAPAVARAEEPPAPAEKPQVARAEEPPAP